MANLNFQQPPRIPSASLSRNTNSGFTSNSISGNVTPTSSLMFQTQQSTNSNSNFVSQQSGQQVSAMKCENLNDSYNFTVQQQSQLSPNRSGQLTIGGGSGNIVGSGSMNNRRMYQNPSIGQRGGSGFGSSMMGSFMQSQARYGSQGGSSGLNNFQSVFGSSDTPPTLLDMSEFPSLTNARGQNDQHSNVLQAPGSKPYVGMVKQPTSEQTEFQMSSEDFPALPGTQSENLAGVVGSGVSGQQHSSSLSVSSVIGLSTSGGGHQGMGMDSNPMGDSKNSIGSNLCMDMMQSETVTGGHHMGSHLSGSVSEKAKRGVQTSPNGLVTNIPATMVNNQFGMIGLLTFIRAAESDPNLGKI